MKTYNKILIAPQPRGIEESTIFELQTRIHGLKLLRWKEKIVIVLGVSERLNSINSTVPRLVSEKSEKYTILLHGYRVYWNCTIPENTENW